MEEFETFITLWNKQVSYHLGCPYIHHLYDRRLEECGLLIKEKGLDSQSLTVISLSRWSLEKFFLSKDKSDLFSLTKLCELAESVCKIFELPSAESKNFYQYLQRLDQLCERLDKFNGRLEQGSAFFSSYVRKLQECDYRMLSVDEMNALTNQVVSLTEELNKLQPASTPPGKVSQLLCQFLILTTEIEVILPDLNMEEWKTLSNNNTNTWLNLGNRRKATKAVDMGFENAASYNNSQSWRQLLEEINRWRYSKKIMLDWRDKEKKSSRALAMYYLQLYASKKHFITAEFEEKLRESTTKVNQYLVMGRQQEKKTPNKNNFFVPEQLLTPAKVEEKEQVIRLDSAISPASGKG